MGFHTAWRNSTVRSFTFFCALVTVFSGGISLKKTRLIILFLFILFIVVLSAFGIKELVYYEMAIKPAVVHSDIKSIDLSELSKIIITNNNETIELSPEQAEYQTVSKIFDNKKVKIDNERVYFRDDENYKIELRTGNLNYVLYGCPEISLNTDMKDLNDPVVFVLYDYTNESTMEYLYQIVTISKSDFLKIFE